MYRFKLFLILVLLCNTFCSYSQITTKFKKNDYPISETYMSMDNIEKCIYFSSMDWFTVVDCYNDSGKKMFSFNVQYIADKQTTQFVAMSYKDFDDGEYIIVLKGKTRREFVTLRIFDNNTYATLCDTN